MDIKYNLLLTKSWHDLKHNLIVFLPLVFSLVFILLVTILVGLEFMLFIINNINLYDNFLVFSGLIIIFSLIDILLIIYLTSSIKAMQFGLIRTIISKKKATSRDMFSGMKNFTNAIFKINMIKISILIIPFILLVLLILLGFYASQYIGIALIILSLMIYIIYLLVSWFFITFGFFFINPLITLNKEKSAINLIKQSLKYTRDNKLHVFITWIIIFAINFILNIFLQIISLPARIIPSLIGLPARIIIPLIIIVIPFIIIFIIAGIVIKTWLQIFLFNSYFNKKLKKS